MKQFAWSLMLAGVVLIPLTNQSLADSFDDATRAMDHAFTLQDQLFAVERKSQDDAYAAYQAAMERAWQRYSAEIESVWGAANSKLPSQKEWVTYSKQRDQRSSIDFDQGKVQLEVQLKQGESANEKEIKAKLKQQLAQLFTQPAHEDAALQIPSQGAAFTETIRPLNGQIAFADGSPVTSKNINRFADEVLKRLSLQHQHITTPQGEKEVVALTIKLVPDHLQRRARPYLPQVRTMAKRFDIPLSLIFGIMQTESYFNPLARSSAPAFGLMQLVPQSGGRDAYQYVFKGDKIVSSNYLYNPKNNIELGSAYLKLLQIREMRRIKDSKSRMLCAIAAYNTGGGNVARAFIPNSHNIVRASAIINTMTSEQVYAHLRANLPYKETRNYVQRVWSRMDNYKSWEM